MMGPQRPEDADQAAAEVASPLSSDSDDDNNKKKRKAKKFDPIQNTEHSTNTNFTIENEQLFSFMAGIRADLRARLPLYLDDWSRPKSIIKVINATCFAFIIQLIPALIFAELMDRETSGNLATAETLLSSAIIGIIYALFSGQPLVIMGITGPVAILLGTSYGLTEKFDADYFPFFFWICIWAGLLHVLSAMIGLVSLVWKVTPFTSQIFELFIAITFIYASIRDLLEPIHLADGDDDLDRGAQYATLMIGLVTFYIAWTLHFAETWMTFTRQVRTTISAYNTLIAVVIGTAISYLPGVDQPNNGVGGVDRVNIRMSPWDWKPTAERPWLTNPLDGISTSGIFAAMIPGCMFWLLYIIDHNVSSILTQAPKFNLQKPPAYHWDFFVLGITFIPCAILGLPPGNGLIPQAPLHCRALCTREYKVDNATGHKVEIVTHCEEQRWSGLAQACLMFVALSAFRVLSWIPRGCLFGLFLYLGMGALHGNEIWERVTMAMILAKKRPNIPVVKKVKWQTVQIWTLIQVVCALLVFAVAQFASFGYIYPALLTALVPFRSYVLDRLFQQSDLNHLDPVEETEEEYQEEQRVIHHMVYENYDVEEEFPNRAEFRSKGMRKEMKERNRRVSEIGHNALVAATINQVDDALIGHLDEVDEEENEDDDDDGMEVPENKV